MLRPLGLAFLMSVLPPMLLTGCAGAPPPAKPLMSPLAEARTFGYAEQSVAPDQVQVTYLGPTRRVSLERAERAAEIAGARRLAEDLALWRAAQVALARKAAAFRVIDRRSDANLELREQLEGYPYFPHYYGRRFYRRRYGYYDPFPYDPFLDVHRFARVQVKATVTITLLKRKGRNGIDPRETAAQMSSKYPHALGGPAK
jgi:hypothetical protein